MSWAGESWVHSWVRLDMTRKSRLIVVVICKISRKSRFVVVVFKTMSRKSRLIVVVFYKMSRKSLFRVVVFPNESRLVSRINRFFPRAQKQNKTILFERTSF